jgi:pyridinium-3,5-bisthiocarboxylic acid mononucleotide nickel chelatase
MSGRIEVTEMKKILIINPYLSGISGNMMLGALVDLGADEKKLDGVAKAVSARLDCRVGWKKKRKGKKDDVSTLWIDSSIEGEFKRYGIDDVKALASSLHFKKDASKFARGVFKTIIAAEREVHKTPETADVHLHELGSPDTIFDVLGTAALLEDLGLFGFGVEVFSLPVEVGSGNVETAHGLIPVPAPVTALMLKNFGIPFHSSGIKGELATPTGIAILANLVDEYGLELPVMEIDNTGRGAGTFKLPDRPNFLTLTLARVSGMGARGEGGECVKVLETNVDDVSGEVLGYTLERLYENGALDVQIIPTVTKKNRPGFIMTVITKKEDETKLSKILIEETGTLGIRTQKSYKRFLLKREVVEIDVEISGFKGGARIKIARDDDGRVVNVKPEFDDAKKIAKKTGLPIREVIREIHAQSLECKMKDAD